MVRQKTFFAGQRIGVRRGWAVMVGIGLGCEIGPVARRLLVVVMIVRGEMRMARVSVAYRMQADMRPTERQADDSEPRQAFGTLQSDYVARPKHHRQPRPPPQLLASSA